MTPEFTLMNLSPSRLCFLEAGSELISEIVLGRHSASPSRRRILAGRATYHCLEYGRNFGDRQHRRVQETGGNDDEAVSAFVRACSSESAPEEAPSDTIAE